MEHTQEPHTKGQAYSAQMYKKLAWMLLLCFVVMYVFMYAMVDKLANVVPNVNQFYMAGLMTMPMLIIEILVMGGMYMNKRLNRVLLASGAAGALVFFLCIHNQVGVGDRQFLRSMIPHHAAAVLMVEEADLEDAEIKELARNIITSQKAEIQQMKDKLEELDK